mmetsp:Transcript_18263/g.17392  ORF Transcript_18263/g.17392 Transcript_18263/m.17392 type:complete len:336 (+) Transcript_18263:145-1152(+)
MQLDATSNFDGIAVPSSAVSVDNYYDPTTSTTALQLSANTVTFNIDYSFFNDDLTMTMDFYEDVMVISEDATGNAGDLGEFYFYEIETVANKDSDDPEVPPTISGIMGVTPDSVLDAMGVFNQLQGKETDFVPYMGLQISNESGVCTLGGYNSDVVYSIYSIQWYATTNQSQWQVEVKSLFVKDNRYILESNEDGSMFQVKISIIHDVIYLNEQAFIQFVSDIEEISGFDFGNAHDLELGAIVYYDGQCSELYSSLPWFMVEFPNSVVYETPPWYYTQQFNETMCLFLIVQAEPDYLEQYNVNFILGRPFLMNYYTIFNLNTTATSVGIIESTYT